MPREGRQTYDMSYSHVLLLVRFQDTPSDHQVLYFRRSFVDLRNASVSVVAFRGHLRHVA